MPLGWLSRIGYDARQQPTQMPAETKPKEKDKKPRIPWVRPKHPDGTYVTPYDWDAPEHRAFSLGMEWDVPRDDWGRPIMGRKPELKIDPRPAILVPPRKTYTPEPLDRPPDPITFS